MVVGGREVRGSFYHHPTTLSQAMTFNTESTNVYYLPPRAIHLAARYPSPAQRPYHAAFGDVPPQAKFSISISTPSVLQLLQKYQIKALPFHLTPDCPLSSSFLTRRTLSDFVQLRGWVEKDVIFPTQSILIAGLQAVGVVIIDCDYCLIKFSAGRNSWLEDAFLRLKKEWERGGRDNFGELHVLWGILDTWEWVICKLSFPFGFIFPPLVGESRGWLGRISLTCSSSESPIFWAGFTQRHGISIENMDPTLEASSAVPQVVQRSSKIGKISRALSLESQSPFRQRTHPRRSHKRRNSAHQTILPGKPDCGIG